MRPVRDLGALDGIGLIVGIVVGVAIFEAPPAIFAAAGSPATALWIWLAGGLVAFLGALVYAELATTVSAAGGDYAFLSAAFGKPLAGLFGWAQLAALSGGNVAALAFVCGDHAAAVAGLDPSATPLLAAGAVLLTALIHLAGLGPGRRVQNVLSAAKTLALVALACAGFCAPPVVDAAPAATASGGLGIGLAFILVLYAYGGWSDVAYVAAEVRDRQRNVPRILLAGTLVVTLLYVAVNAAYVRGLGFAATCASTTPASDLLARWAGGTAGDALALIVAVSALGAIHGLVLTGPRVFAALGADQRAFAWLARWHAGRRAPVAAILAQAGVSSFYVGAVGTEVGRRTIDACARACALEAVPWGEYNSGFDMLVSATAPLFWSFFFLTSLSLFVLRRRLPRPAGSFRVPLHPLPGLVFSGACAFMLWSSLSYVGALALLGAALLVPGALLLLVSALIPRRA